MVRPIRHFSLPGEAAQGCPIFTTRWCETSPKCSFFFFFWIPVNIYWTTRNIKPLGPAWAISSTVNPLMSSCQRCAFLEIQMFAGELNDLQYLAWLIVLCACWSWYILMYLRIVQISTVVGIHTLFFRLVESAEPAVHHFMCSNWLIPLFCVSSDGSMVNNSH